MTDPRAEQIARTGRGTGSPIDDAGPATWTEVTAELRRATGTSWLSVRGRRGSVHTRPVFAAWGGSSFFFATNGVAAKTAHLRDDPAVSLAIDVGDLHLVTEGRAVRLRSDDDLARASTAMLEVYGWPTEAAGEHLDASYAAPTSGGPPFEAWEVTPDRVFAFPTRDQVEPTRFVFDD